MTPVTTVGKDRRLRAFDCAVRTAAVGCQSPEGYGSQQVIAVSLPQALDSNARISPILLKLSSVRAVEVCNSPIKAPDTTVALDEIRVQEGAKP